MISDISNLILQNKNDFEKAKERYAEYQENKMKTFIDICKMTSTEAYRQGWIDGHCSDSKYPQTVVIAGYSLDQILDFISDKDKEKKMTREEAHTKCFQIANQFEGRQIDQILTIIEALGLIKFDEPPKRKYIFFPHPDERKNNVAVYQDDAINTLNEYGYDIIKRK